MSQKLDNRERMTPIPWKTMFVLLVAICVAEFFVEVPHHFKFEFTGFHAIFGGIASLVMIVVAKLYGFLVKRPTDYYAKHREGKE